METEQCRTPASVRSMMPARRALSRLCGEGPSHVSKRDALSAVRAAAGALGLDATDRQLIDAFAALTPADDWDKGQPFVMAQNRTLMAKAGIGSERTVTRRLARLERLGLILRRMSGNGQRRVQRLSDDKILVAWGIDLSPMQKRRGELLALAREHAEALQRRKAEALTITARRREAEEACAALREIGAFEDAARIEGELYALFPAHLRRSREIERLDDERRMALAGEIELLLGRALEAFDAVFGGENLSDAADVDDRHHIRPDPLPDPSNHRRCADAQQVIPPVIDAASGGGSSRKGGAEAGDSEQAAETAPGAARDRRPRRSARVLKSIALPVLKIACARFVEDHSYMPLGTWDEMFRVAEMVRHQLKVDDRLWGRTCQALGHRRDLIAALVAYIWERRHSEDDGFRLGRPDAVGGYFRRCVEAAEAKELNLDVSIYAMASRQQGRS